MVTKPEDFLQDVYEHVQYDVTEAVRKHPQYDQLIAQLAEQGFQALVKLITTAV
jgi:hypothetical protein